MEQEKESNLLEAEYGQKALTPSSFNSSILGLPGSFSGTDRKSNFVWNKRGVALAYMIVPILKTCVDLIAKNLAGVPMVMKDGNGNIVARSDTSGSETSGFLSALERSYKYYNVPLIQNWATSMLLYGESYTQKIFSTMGDVRNLKWLNPLAVTINMEYSKVSKRNSLLLDDNDILTRKKSYLYTSNFGSVTLEEDEVLMSRDFNPVDDIRGYSDALAALSKANIIMEFETFTIAFYDNSGHPGVIISPKDRLVSETHVANWQQEWNNKFRGAHQQFKTHISSFPFDVETFDLIDVSKPLQVAQDAEDKIMNVFRVPKALVGGGQEAGHQFSKETKNAFMQTVVRPLGLSISNSINHSGIIRDFEDSESGTLKFGFDFSEFETVAKTDLDRQSVLQNQVQSGMISIGQYQRSGGATVVDGADDTYMMPQGFVIVKKEDLAQPENIVQPGDQTGPDENPINQSDRVTQSQTEEQESTDFYGNKSTPLELVVPDKYIDLDVVIPDGSENFLKSHFNAIVIDGQMPPSEIERVYNEFYKSVEEFDDNNIDSEVVFGWLERNNQKMVEVQKQEARKGLTVETLQRIAEEQGIGLEETLKFFEEFDNDYK